MSSTQETVLSRAATLPYHDAEFYKFWLNRSFDRFNESSRRAYTLMRQMSRHSSRRQTANQLSFTFLHCLTWSWGGRRFHLYRCLLKLLHWIMYVCLYLHLTLLAYSIHIYQVSSTTRCGLGCVSLNEDTLAEARSQGRNLYDEAREGAHQVVIVTPEQESCAY